MHSLIGRSPAAIGQRVLMLALAAAAGCSQRGAIGDEIGIAVALNPQRAGMQSIYNGAQLAVNELNKQYGSRLGSRRLVMLKGAPDVTDPIRIADAFREDARVVGVVGHPESGTTLAAIDEYADAKNNGANGVVAISPPAPVRR
jgi:ABC-type branched-subunit amino acid transport system substrate-binding protein